MRLEALEDRCLLAIDFGDAPDTGAGTGIANYQTVASDNGPSHTIVNGLELGPSVDGELNATPNVRASGDDIASALPDDEDGVFDPADLLFTTGTTPRVRLRTTNTIGVDATLSGWIDYDRNGVFDNTTERAQATVSSGTNNEIVTLTFPIVPQDASGKTYARFRISTDAAAGDPTGVVADGEVEDYSATITAPSSGQVKSHQTISETQGNFTGILDDFDEFGRSLTSIGDLDGDGVTDVAVGVRADDDGGGDRGAVWVLFLNIDGTVKSHQKISDIEGNFTGTLEDSDQFGSSVASLGDLNGDGVTDLAVGAVADFDGGSARGAVWVLFLNSDGTVNTHQKISNVEGGFSGGLSDFDIFGKSVASLGDLNGDGVTDLAVGAFADDDGGQDRGAVWVLFLNPNGTVKSHQAISDTEGNFTGTLRNIDLFGISVASLGDVDGDGLTDLAVGAEWDDDGGPERGAVWLLFLNANGTVKGHQKISDTAGGFAGTLDDRDNFGTSVAALSDLDGDGIRDLAVGAYNDDDGDTNTGAVWVLFLNADGSVKSHQKISDIEGNFAGTLDSFDMFGTSLASLGDLDGDGIPDLAVGAAGDGEIGVFHGAVRILNLHAPPVDPIVTWNNPSDITFGAMLGDTQFNATANTAGTFVYTPAAGTQLNAGANQSLSVTFIPTDPLSFNSVTANVSIDVLKADLAITWNHPADITFGNLLGDAQLNATANGAGTFVYDPSAGMQLDAGANQQLSVVFTPGDPNNFSSASANATVAINVLKADPAITWSNPADITFGALLGDTQLNATANISGTFVYNPAAGTQLNVGVNQQLQMTFTPTDTDNFNNVNANVTINVAKADPVVSWNNPADITFGTLLGDAQLNATANTAGTFVYNPANGTQLNAGANQQLSVAFTPTDADNFNNANANVVINVSKAEPIITWNNPADITFGTLLGDMQFNATANAAGTFVYNPASGTQLNAGANQQLQVTFTPTDTLNFNPVTANVTINVTKTDPAITWNNPADITFGILLSATQFNASANTAGSFAYNPASGTQLNAGVNQPLQVTFTPADKHNFNGTSANVTINVAKADPIITWNNPADITLGTLLGDMQLNATASTAGSFTYNPAAETQLDAGANQQLSVTFTPTDTANFNDATASVTINVLAFDFGDAPVAYPVTLAQDGARHTPGNLFLGSLIDAEANGQPTTDATGEGGDEDGVFETAGIVAASSAVTKSSFAVVSSGTGKLDAWIDFNQDGDWSDAGEQIFTNENVAAGLNLLGFNVPAGATPGATGARFRLSSAGGLAPIGAAADGEVEDDLVTILDGDAQGGATVDIALPTAGALAVVADGNDIVVRTGASELFRAPGTGLRRLTITGTDGDDTMNVADLDAIFMGLIGGDAGAGRDILRVTGGEQEIDLTQTPDADLQGIEEIDIRGSGNNTLVLNESEVRNLSPTSDTLLVRLDRGDTVIFGSGWTVDAPLFIDGETVHQQHQGATIVQVISTRPFQNPFDALDTNRDGTISPIDVLLPINALTDEGSRALPAPTSAAKLPVYYFDTNGDGNVSPIDVLLPINFLTAAGAIPEGESIVWWLAPSQQATASTVPAAVARARPAVTAIWIESPVSPTTVQRPNEAAVALPAALDAQVLDELLAALDEWLA